MLIIESKNLLPMLKNFHIATGTKIAIFNLNFEEILAQPYQQSPFCEYLKSCPEGAERCRLCDMTSQAIIRKTGAESYIYTCHSGLKEAIAPIKDGKTLIGYIMIGQCVTGDLPIEAVWDETKCSCSSYIDLDEVKKDFFALPRATDEQLEAFVGILTVYASYICTKDYVRLKHQSDFIKVKEYIANNLSGNLSAEHLCSEIFMTRNSLYKLVREETDMTLGQYVQSKRLNFSRLLIKTTNDSILNISEQCGINDFNYFSRLFKKEFGQTPREYRRNCLKK